MTLAPICMRPVENHWRVLVVAVVLVAAFGSDATVFSTRVAAASQSPVTENRKVMIQRSRANAFVAVTSVRNQEEEAWLEKLEIEVKNISVKPIYYLSIVVQFPDLVTTAVDGIPRTQLIPLSYGRRDLLRDGSLAGANDISINPGQSYVFTIPEQYRKGLQDRLAAGLVPESAVRKVVIGIDSLSFGDGTGFNPGGT